MGGLIIAACFAIPFALFGFVHLIARIEARRLTLQRLDEALGDGADGAGNLKSLFHAPINSDGAQRDHG